MSPDPSPLAAPAGATTTARRSGHVAAPVEQVFEAVLSLPLPQLYRRRYGPMPPIVEVRDQQGEWDTPGQTRVFVTGDGGSMHEEMLALERPHYFTNRLTVLAGPFKPIVASVVETWELTAVAGGTEATWTWHLTPKSAPARLLLPVVGRLWRGYAGQVLAQLRTEVA